MLVVALDTSTLMGTVGWILINDESKTIEAFAECSAPAKPGHAETLLDRLNNILSHGGYGIENIDLLVFGRGPGTFTGLRIGLSTIKGLAMAYDIPIIGISSLKALALPISREALVATVIDARRSELFAGLWRCRASGQIDSVCEEWVSSASKAIEKLKGHCTQSEVPVVLTGNGITEYREQLLGGLPKETIIASQRDWTASAYWMALAGYQDFIKNGPDDLDSTLPVYLRKPDAKLPKPR